MLVFTHDKDRLLEHFRRDPVLFAYHIGDLDEFFFKDCQWAVCLHKSTRIDEAILVYHAGRLPTVLAFGHSERFVPFLEEAVDLLPSTFYCHFFSDYRGIFTRLYDEKSLGTHQKMKLSSFVKSHTQEDEKTIRRLDHSHLEELSNFYRLAYPDNYFIDRMLLTGKYFGYFIDNRLVSVAGVHVYSQEYNIAVLGNIATLPKYQGRHLAAKTTSRLVTELVDEGSLVTLNVKSDNESAISCYHCLGFEKTHNYEEALFVRK